LRCFAQQLCGANQQLVGNHYQKARAASGRLFSFLEEMGVDLRQYFKKIRETEEALAEPFPLIVSLETPEGGKSGVVSEVSREIAAKMLVEGRAVLANEKERHAYFDRQAAIRKAAEKADLSRRLQFAIITDPNFNSVPVPEPEQKASVPPASRK
jgi:hypothetical protein